MRQTSSRRPRASTALSTRLVAFNQAARKWIEAQPRTQRHRGGVPRGGERPRRPARVRPRWRRGRRRRRRQRRRRRRAPLAASWSRRLRRRRIPATSTRRSAGSTPPSPRASGPLDLAERRRVAVAEQRRRFGVVASRGDHVVFVAAPQPGVLVSRYVQHLDAEEPKRAWAMPTTRRPASRHHQHHGDASRRAACASRRRN